jgi:DnaJ-related protein SCJ1
LNLKEALLGYNKKITHLDKREFYIDSKTPTQPFYIRKIDGEGMPQHKYPSHKGDLYVKFLVRLPDRLSEAEKQLVREMFD